MAKKEKVIEKKEAPAEELPVIETVGVFKMPNMGPNGWTVITLKTQGNNVIEVNLTEPNMRQICIEEAKIQFVKKFFEQ